MALVNQVQKRAIMTKWDVIKFQISTHCYINKITVSDSDLNCLTLLSITGSIELTHFCYDASSEEEWKTEEGGSRRPRGAVEFHVGIVRGKSSSTMFPSQSQ